MVSQTMIVVLVSVLYFKAYYVWFDLGCFFSLLFLVFISTKSQIHQIRMDIYIYVYKTDPFYQWLNRGT